jgi:Flp pilus assembly protein TadG
MRLNKRDDAGLAAILVVVASTFILAVVAIGVDVGRAVAVTRSAQNSADAVALATAMDCVRRGAMSADYEDYLQSAQAIGQGQTADLTAGSCPEGFVTATASETMDYTFAKVIGMTDIDLDRPATARWSQLNSGVIFPFTFSTCAFPESFTMGDTTTPGTPLMLYGHGVRTTCNRDSDADGQSNNSKGFVQDGCVMTSLGEALKDGNGDSLSGTGCASDELNDYVGEDVLLPVWGSAAPDGPGGNAGSLYTITNLVGFHVLGWSLQGNGKDKYGGAMAGRCEALDGFRGDSTTVGEDTKPCLYGYVTSFSSSTGGHTDAPCTTGGAGLSAVDNDDPLPSACHVYLEPPDA